MTEAEIDEIRMLLHNHPLWNRSRLSRELCMRWNWQRPDGQIKDMACRELLRKLDSRTLIKLPPRQCPGPGRLPTIESVEVDRSPISCSLSDIKPVKIVNARNCAEYEKAFNYLVKEYHYLSYGRPVGQNMKYMILGRNERFLGCLLFGAAAWKAEARDRWIGWSAEGGHLGSDHANPQEFQDKHSRHRRISGLSVLFSPRNSPSKKIRN